MQIRAGRGYQSNKNAEDRGTLSARPNIYWDINGHGSTATSQHYCFNENNNNNCKQIIDYDNCYPFQGLGCWLFRQHIKHFHICFGLSTALLLTQLQKNVPWVRIPYMLHPPTHFLSKHLQPAYVIELFNALCSS